VNMDIDEARKDCEPACINFLVTRYRCTRLADLGNATVCDNETGLDHSVRQNKARVPQVCGGRIFNQGLTSPSTVVQNKSV